MQELFPNDFTVEDEEDEEDGEDEDDFFVFH